MKLLAFLVLAFCSLSVFSQSCPASKDNVIIQPFRLDLTLGKINEELAKYFLEKSPNVSYYDKYGRIININSLSSYLAYISDKSNFAYGDDEFRITQQALINRLKQTSTCHRVVMSHYTFSYIKDVIRPKDFSNGYLGCHCFDTVSNEISGIAEREMESDYGGTFCYLRKDDINSFRSCLEKSFNRPSATGNGNFISPFDTTTLSCKNGLIPFHTKPAGNIDGNYDCYDFSNVDFRKADASINRAFSWLQNASGSFKGAKFDNNILPNSINAKVQSANFQNLSLANVSLNIRENNITLSFNNIDFGFNNRLNLYPEARNLNSKIMNSKGEILIDGAINDSSERGSVSLYNNEKAGAVTFNLVDVKASIGHYDHLRLSKLKCSNSDLEIALNSNREFTIEDSVLKDCSLTSLKPLSLLTLSSSSFAGLVISNLPESGTDILINSQSLNNSMIIKNSKFNKINIESFKSSSIEMQSVWSKYFFLAKSTDAKFSFIDSRISVNTNIDNSSNLNFNFDKSALTNIDINPNVNSLKFIASESSIDRLNSDVDLKIDFNSKNTSLKNVKVSGLSGSTFIMNGGQLIQSSLAQDMEIKLNGAVIDGLKLLKTNLELGDSNRITNSTFETTNVKVTGKDNLLKALSWNQLTDLAIIGAQNLRLENITNANKVIAKNTVGLAVINSSFPLEISGDKTIGTVVSGFSKQSIELLGVFEKAKIINSHFTKARMDQSEFYDSSFENVTIENGYLKDVFLRDTTTLAMKFTSSNVQGLSFTRAKKVRLSFNDSNFVKISSFSSEINEINVSNSSFSLFSNGSTIDSLIVDASSKLGSISMISSNLKSANFHNPLVEGTIKFKDSILTNIDFTSFKFLKFFSFLNSTLLYCNFDGLFLNGADFTGSKLDGSSFYGASTLGANFDLVDTTTADGLYL